MGPHSCGGVERRVWVPPFGIFQRANQKSRLHLCVCVFLSLSRPGWWLGVVVCRFRHVKLNGTDIAIVW